MTYIITNYEKLEDTISTSITYIYNSIEYSTTVQHFRPESIEDIELGIQNRIASEISKLEAIDTVNGIVIPLNVEKTI